MRKNNILIALLGIALFSSYAFSKEPTNILVGVGIGAGQSRIDIEHTQIMRFPLRDNGTTNWPAQQNSSLSSWAFAWEFLLGYKHFINDFVGFRYYGNIGVQHYKPISFKESAQKIALIDYTLNADLLIDFWESELWAIGAVGGLGFGGTSFDKDAVSKYLAVYDAKSKQPIGLANVQKHFFNVNASVGLRMAFFQKIRRVKERVCDENYVNGKRLCRVPVHYIGHNIEVNAKFPLMDYRATPYPDVLPQGTDNKSAISRPGYTVTNPYRITVRYVVDF